MLGPTVDGSDSIFRFSLFCEIMVEGLSLRVTAGLEGGRPESLTYQRSKFRKYSFESRQQGPLSLRRGVSGG